MLLYVCVCTQRCVEVESLQGQVSQEKELRTVMEGCLMEEKMAWRGVQAELRESVNQIQALNGTLHTLRNARTQLTQATGTGLRVRLLRNAHSDTLRSFYTTLRIHSLSLIGLAPVTLIKYRKRVFSKTCFKRDPKLIEVFTYACGAESGFGIFERAISPIIILILYQV